MKKRYSEEQIIKAINKRHESGVKVEDIVRDLGISIGAFYNWRSKYAGLEVNEAKRLRELETENNNGLISKEENLHCYVRYSFSILMQKAINQEYLQASIIH